MTAVSRQTGAHVATSTLMAGGSIMAGVVLAAGDRGAAVLPSITWWAGASVAILCLLTGAAILAQKGLAMSNSRVDVFTVGSKEALRTLTKIGVHKIYTFCTV